MGKVINKNLITEIEPTIKLGKKNQEVWERIEKLAKEINRLNKKKVSVVKILLKERKSKY
jgi:DNA/RNA endonuclease G (NUC1)